MDDELPDPGLFKDDLQGRRSHGVVLYVEDDDESRLSITTLLRTSGFEVQEAATAVSALALTDSLKNRLDVLIVDYHLGSGSTGTEVAETLVRDLGHGVPTIILTGDPANAEVPWLKNSPLWLIRKPVLPLQLIAGLWPLVAFARAMRRMAPR